MTRKGKQPLLSFSKVLEINSALEYYYRNHGEIITGDKLIALYDELVGLNFPHGYEKEDCYKIYVKDKKHVLTVKTRVLPPNDVPVGLPTLQEANGASLDSKRSPDAE